MKNRLSKWLKYSLLLLGALLIAVGTFFILLFSGGFGAIPNERELKDIQNQSASLIFASNGDLIGKFYKENRTKLPYDSLPENLINALIATEDARFYQHEGVDGRALFRVLLKTMILGDRSSGGGSTLSQQLAKNLYGRKNYGKFSIVINKLKEIILANRLENLYSKEEIIELYLNTVPFGENLFGVEAASRRYFSKATWDLKTEESAVLVGLLKANSFYNPRLHPINAKKRRNVVIEQMLKYDYLTAKQSDSLQGLKLQLNYQNLARESTTPYFLDRMKAEAELILNEASTEEKSWNLETDGLTIISTLDHELQENLYRGMERHLKKMQKILRRQYLKGASASKLDRLVKKLMAQNNINNKGVKERLFFDWEEGEKLISLNTIDSLKYILTQLQVGAIAMDPRNGAIRSWIGGIDYRYYPYDQVVAKRQLASTFKPILYAAALNRGFEPCDYFSNEEVTLTDYDDWSPSNYDGNSGGEYSMAAALAFSKNLPTLDLYLQTGWEAVNQVWDALGFIEELNQEPSVILGTNSASLFQLVKAYSSFANGGLSIEPYTVQKILSADGKVIFQKDPQRKLNRVLDPEISSQLNRMLAKTVNEGTANAIRNRFDFPYPLAAKTGTSQRYADAWTLIYNRNLVCGVRVGASFPSIHFNSGQYGSSTALALPIIGHALQSERNRGAAWVRGGLLQSRSVDCENFREIKGIEKVLQIFRKKETSLEQAEKRSKRKGFFKKVFGK